MTAPTEPDSGSSAAEALRRAVEACQANGEFLAEIEDIYRGVDRAVAERSPACRACGKCCDFPRAPHRLYLSTGELALLAASPAADPQACRAGLCNYQSAGRCAARAHRPLGCRAFFCAAELTQWSNELYEAHHARIKALHDRHGVSYQYGELAAMLGRLDGLAREAGE